jgi:hypothetical protein
VRIRRKSPDQKNAYGVEHCTRRIEHPGSISGLGANKECGIEVRDATMRYQERLAFTIAEVPDRDLPSRWAAQEARFCPTNFSGSCFPILSACNAIQRK